MPGAAGKFKKALQYKDMSQMYTKEFLLNEINDIREKSATKKQAFPLKKFTLKTMNYGLLQRTVPTNQPSSEKEVG
jgi:hypothetical protein